jgi:26S proteasome regulatory subunit N3
MVDDTKMSDADAKPKKEEDEAKKPPKEDGATPTEEAAPKAPPLQAAGLRLERLLGDSSYSHPAKVVRRWLTTSSGASTSTALTDIGQAARALLRPCPDALAALVDDMETEETEDNDAKKTDPEKKAAFLTETSAVPYEAWLMSLAVRCYYKDGQADQALALVQQGIEKVSAQLQQDIVRSTAAALYPLLARLIRWRSLIIEQHFPQQAAALRSEMAQAYNLATLRRDADTQATLLNCMLRDLLHSSQSKSVIIYPPVLLIQ